MQEKWYQSRRVWSAIISGIFGIYAIIKTITPLFGIPLPDLPNVDIPGIVDKIFGFASLIAGLLASLSWLKPK